MEKTVVELKADAYDIIAKIQAYAQEIKRLESYLSQLNETIQAKSSKEDKQP